MRDVLTICGYCGCGCGLYLHEEDGCIVGATPSRNHPVSRNNLCVKGWHIHEFIHHHQRLTTPLLRQNGRLEPVTWEEALDFTAASMNRLKNAGKQLGFLASAKCTNEENYLLQKFARSVFKTNNIDHCARL